MCKRNYKLLWIVSSEQKKKVLMEFSKFLVSQGDKSFYNTKRMHIVKS